MVSTNHVKLAAPEPPLQPVRANRNAAASTAAVIRRNCFKEMTSFYGICWECIWIQKALCFDKCSRNEGKIQLRNCEFPLLFGAKGRFSVANCGQMDYNGTANVSAPLCGAFDTILLIEEELFLCRRISRNWPSSSRAKKLPSSAQASAIRRSSGSSWSWERTSLCVTRRRA